MPAKYKSADVSIHAHVYIHMYVYVCERLRLRERESKTAAACVRVFRHLFCKHTAGKPRTHTHALCDMLADAHTYTRTHPLVVVHERDACS